MNETGGCVFYVPNATNLVILQFFQIHVATLCIAESLTVRAVCFLPNFTDRAKAVYMYLKSMAASKGECWPGIKTIASDLCLSRSTVKRALADLEKHGYILKECRHRDNGSFTSNLYRIK